MIISSKGGIDMSYAICYYNSNNNDYYLPMNLIDIDKLFTITLIPYLLVMILIIYI